MPARDKTGPLGAGAMTGRRLGACTGVNAPIYGGWQGRGCGRGFGGFGRGVRAAGMGRGQGFGQGFGRGRGQGYGQGYAMGANIDYNYDQASSKEALQAQKKELQMALDAIDKQLDSL